MVDIPKIGNPFTSHPQEILIPDYPDDQGSPEDIERFRKDVARQLDTTPDRVMLKLQDGLWQATVVGNPEKTRTLSFADPNDELRLTPLAKSSRSPVLVDFGKPPTARTIRIPVWKEAPSDSNPPDTEKQKIDGFREQELKQKVERFKCLIAEQLQVNFHEVQILPNEGGLVAVLPATGEPIDLLFEDPQEQREFVKLAQESKAPELLYFGQRPGKRTVTLPPFPKGDDPALAREFIQQVSRQLGTAPEDIQVNVIDGEFLAFIHRNDPVNLTLNNLNLFAGDQHIDILFARGEDYERLLKLAPHSKSPVLTNFGTPPSRRTLRITPYNPNDGRDKNIQRFKDDVAREMGTAPANIEIRYEGGVLEAYLADGKEPVDIVFANPEDFTFFAKTAILSKSTRLEYFGQKRTDTRVELSASTGFPDPAGKTSFSQTITGETFIGNSGLNKLRYGISSTEPFDSPFFDRANLKNLTLGFHNLNWGGGDFSFDGHTLRLVGLESTFLTTQFNTRKDTYLNRVLQGDPEAILTGLGVLAGVGAAAYAFSEWWPHPETLNLPLKTKLYHDGTLEINAGSEQNLILGGKKREMEWKGGNLEVKESIASGVSANQAAAYNPQNQQLATNLGLTWQRLNLGVGNTYDFKTDHLLNTHFSTGYGFDLAPRWVMSLGYQQDLTDRGVTTNPTGSTGFTYTPNPYWLFNLNSCVTAPRFGEPASYGLTFKTGIAF